MKGARLMLLGTAAALAACAGPRSLAGLDAELRARIAADYVAPFKSGDIDRWVGIFADDALALHNGPPAMKGREAIRAFGESVKTHFEVRRFDVTVDELRSDGRWALTAGHYAAEFAPRRADAYAGASGPRTGKFQFIWERRKGVWLIISDMGNSTDPAPAK